MSQLNVLARTGLDSFGDRHLFLLSEYITHSALVKYVWSINNIFNEYKCKKIRMLIVCRRCDGNYSAPRRHQVRWTHISLSTNVKPMQRSISICESRKIVSFLECVSGTEKQAVAYDYAKRVAVGVAAAQVPNSCVYPTIQVWWVMPNLYQMNWSLISYLPDQTTISIVYCNRSFVHSYTV